MARRPRYPFEVLAAVQPLSGEETSAFHGTTRDLGEGGLCLLCEHPVALGEPLKVHLELATRPAPIQLLGRVVWARPEPEPPRYRLGVRIELLEVSDALELQAELSRLAERQARAALGVSV